MMIRRGKRRNMSENGSEVQYQEVEEEKHS